VKGLGFTRSSRVNPSLKLSMGEYVDYIQTYVCVCVCVTEDGDADAADTYDRDTDAAAYGGDEL